MATLDTRTDLVEQARRVIARAARHEIELTFDNFTVVDGEIWLDGMDPDEWIDAMVMD